MSPPALRLTRSTTDSLGSACSAGLFTAVVVIIVVVVVVVVVAAAAAVIVVR